MTVKGETLRDIGEAEEMKKLHDFYPRLALYFPPVEIAYPVISMLCHTWNFLQQRLEILMNSHPPVNSFLQKMSSCIDQWSERHIIPLKKVKIFLVPDNENFWGKVNGKTYFSEGKFTQPNTFSETQSDENFRRSQVQLVRALRNVRDDRNILTKINRKFPLMTAPSCSSHKQLRGYVRNRCQRIRWVSATAAVPPDIAGGYLCFVVSIFGIGVVTAVIGDVASYFGCTLGIKDSVTAVAFVALGTSIPDVTILGACLFFGTIILKYRDQLKKYESANDPQMSQKENNEVFTEYRFCELDQCVQI
ncbi:Sodium/calcium exchanger 1 [Melipona quadrifasciata]|uniref:Sodium/calcium exchanger 1 n=1 Tax=Melipona quadrifasciata TaxID=166423 RepID=A0A0M8ZTU5_9HYME|nr:Sodium/calcium exchanger 1 [Melipona quadrifasciata]